MHTRALLIEDNQADYVRIRSLLRSTSTHEIELDWVSTSQDGYQKMIENKYDVYLLDYLLDTEDGMSVLERARRDGCHNPVLFLTGFGDRDLDMQAMKIGASDFLIKDKLDADLLERTIRYAVQNSRIRNALEVSSHEKEVLLREIHHRVKNNLQIVASMLRLQSRKVDSEQARTALVECCDRIQSIGLIHNQLYREKRFHAINFSEYLQSLITELSHAYVVDPGRVKIQTSIEHSEIPLTLAVPCGLIVHELVTNSIKHAFPKGNTGIITISFRRREDASLELAVKDSGIGIPVKFTEEVADSLGLELIRALALQIRASISVNGNGGTEWVLVFPDRESSRSENLLELS